MKRKRVFTLIVTGLLAVAIGIFASSYFSYRFLESDLAAKRWKSADEKTSQIILNVSGRKWTGSIADLLGWKNTLKEFPCQDLQDLDRLWTQYSENRFGLSVQQEIFQSLKIEDFNGDWFKLYDAFFDKVGWQYMYQPNSAPEFDLRAPRGHLPSPNWMLKAGGTEKTIPWMTNGIYLFQRIKACKLSQ